MIAAVWVRMAVTCISLVLTGCASIVSGTSEPVTVNTTPAGSLCVLERGGEVVGQVYAPGSVTVTKSRSDITVHCNKQGYFETDAVCTSGTSGWVAGNILFGLIGGPIGIVTDVSDGAVNDYDDVVTITLTATPAEDAPVGEAHPAHYPQMTAQ